MSRAIGFVAVVVLVSPFTSDEPQTVAADRGPITTVGPATTREVILEVATTIAVTITVPTTTSVPPTTTSSLRAVVPAGDDTTVVRVIDGDTIEVTGGTRVRLIGIDTPETSTGPDCSGPEATRYAKELLPAGTRIRLVYDVQRLDRYRRTLAYVYKLTDGVFVNLAIARNGFAVQATYPPNVAHAEEFRSAVAEARNSDLGLWGACGFAAAPVAAAPTTRATVALTPRTEAPATAAPTTRATAAVHTTAASSSDCHPSYSGACVPTGFSDVDCAGGGGNGPGYVSGKNFRVHGVSAEVIP